MDGAVLTNGDVSEVGLVYVDKMYRCHTITLTEQLYFVSCKRATLFMAASLAGAM